MASKLNLVLVLGFLVAAAPVYAQTAHAGAPIPVGSGFAFPSGVAVDGSGNVFVVDQVNDAVYEIVAVNGVVSSNSIVNAVGTKFDYPSAVAVDASGDVFVADTGNNAVKEIVAVNGLVSSDSMVTTVGSGFSQPHGVAVDASGDVFVGDTVNREVKEIVAVNGAVSSSSAVNVVGSGFSYPSGVAVDAQGNVYVADENSHAVKEIVAVNGVVSSSSTVNTIGSGPEGVAVDARGNVFVADPVNDAVKEIVAVNGVVSSSSTVNTIGTGFNIPLGVAVDARGNVFVADSGNAAVKEIVAGAQTFSVTPVGSVSAPVTAYFTFDTAGSLASTPYVVLTQGAQNLDFQAGTQSSNACAAGVTYNAGDICAVNVTFTPTVPGQRIGSVQLMGSTGTPIATVPLSGVGTGPQAIFNNSKSVQLGSGFNEPGIAVDGSGDVFVANYGDNTVKEIVATNGIVSSTSPIQRISTSFGFAAPSGVAVDGSGNLYIADTTNYALEEIVALNGAVSASSPVVTIHSFGSPQAVAVDGSGNVYLADYNSGLVYEIVAVNGIVSSSSTVNTIGSGFSGPQAVAVDANGDVFVADSGNRAVKEIVAVNGVVSSSSVVNTIGSGFSSPNGLAVDTNGDVFVADANQRLIKEIVASSGAVSSSSPVVTIKTGYDLPVAVVLDSKGNLYVADLGNNVVSEIDRTDPPSFSFASTPVNSSSSPQSISIENSGNQPLNAMSPGLSIGPNFTQVPGSGTPSDCTADFSLAPGVQCNLSVSFTPTTVGNPLTGAATFTDNALNVPPSASQVIQLSGVSTAGTPTIAFTAAASYAYGQSFQATATSNSSGAITYSLVSGPATVTSQGAVSVTGVGSVMVQASQAATNNYQAATQTVTFSAVQASTTIGLTGQVNTPPGNTATLNATVNPQYAGTPTGTVTFYNGATAMSTVPLSGGKASYTTPALSGSQTFTAVYNGDANFTASPASNTVSLTLSVPPTITFTMAANYGYGQSFQAAATSNSTGAITYALVSGPANVASSGLVTVTGEGPVIVQASQAAAPGYNAAVKQASFSATQATSAVTLTATLTSSGFGSAATLSAVVSPQFTGTPTGTVTFYDGANVLATVTLSAAVASYTTPQLVGSAHTFWAVYSGDANFTTSKSPSMPLAVPVTTVNLNFAATQLVYPLPPAFEIQVAPASGKPAPTGTVTVYDGSVQISSFTLYAAERGILLGLVLPPLNVGTHSIQAAYSGDANHAPGQSAVVAVTVTPGPVSVSLSCASTKLKSGQTLSCTVNANEGMLPVTGTVDYTITGVGSSSISLSKAGQATIAAQPSPGNGTITATYSAQGNYEAAAPATVNFTIK